MLSKISVTHLKASPSASTSGFSWHGNQRRFGYCARNSSQFNKPRFKIVGKSLGDRWKLNEIDANAVQEKLNSWLLKTQNFLNEVTSPLVRTSQTRKPVTRDAFETQDMEDIFMAEQTINNRTPNGVLSLAAIVSIEQFSRMNGLTGQKMQRIFKALVSESTYNDARNLVEYCCFRFLSRDNSDIHPSLKSKLVREEAFVRVAPAISGVADRSTAHNLFKALAGDEQGISLSLWLTYVDELIKVHEGRKSYQTRQSPDLSEERILCIGSSRKRPVLKWENNMAWPGKVTLTDKAIYFEAVGISGQKDSIRLDLTKHGLRVEKAKVGPFGSDLFDSAVSISYGPKSEAWVLEFVDLGGEMRRDVWHAFISEIIALHKFIRDYGPEEVDESLSHVYGAHKGKERAMNSAINSIARLQALQFMRKLLDDPTKLVQFTYLQYAPYGDIVSQTLAVNYWGGPLISKFLEVDNPPAQGARASNEMIESSNHVFDIDGSVYLQKWKRSPCWASSASASFWKSTSTRQGLVLSKNLVVADAALVERATRTCKQKWQAAETTQATIDAATLKGIPSNIDLFKISLIARTLMGLI
ncbi:hypothetical protein PRUPE_1G566800 [Prunus persica]|uniref:Uncharacterized protein n=1 Tax=Prunus persica TaxID=3760 RepID=A0A251RJ57_PRUPE|nr:hypothetical protein PRUPE_1G566800 [Prunus persica]